jgi:hypothetical protein
MMQAQCRQQSARGGRALTAVTVKNAVFWDVMPCSRVGVHRLSQGNNQQNAKTSSDFLLIAWFTYRPEDGGSKFIRDVSELSPDL